MARKIGFVGLGSMGLPMATNLVSGGFEVRGFDLAPEALAQLSRSGARLPRRRRMQPPAQISWS